MKCQICREQESEWAWQPFGPNDNPATYALLGSHYRGFPVVKVCILCKSAFLAGDFEVRFEYKGFKYIGKDHKVREENPSFYDGGTTDFNHTSVSMVMRDMPGDMSDELIAVVCESEWLAAFVALPDLMAACEQIANVFRDTADYRLTSEQGMAIASAHNALARAQGKDNL
jgi:hypothetical protein